MIKDRGRRRVEIEAVSLADNVPTDVLADALLEGASHVGRASPDGRILVIKATGEQVCQLHRGALLTWFLAKSACCLLA